MNKEARSPTAQSTSVLAFGWPPLFLAPSTIYLFVSQRYISYKNTFTNGALGLQGQKSHLLMCFVPSLAQGPMKVKSLTNASSVANG